MKIAFLGDIAFFGKFDNSNRRINEYFKEVSEYLSTFDLVVGNLETPFSTSHLGFGAKSAYIKSKPDNIDILEMLHVGVVNLANNHIFDFGIEGYELTKKILEERKIHYFGIENKTFYFENGVDKIAFSGYCCYSTNPVGMLNNQGVGINPLNYERIHQEMQFNSNQGFFNMISIHAGEEHVNIPNPIHINFARQLAADFNYLFYGHHPHVLQGVERVNNSLIAYSLGNFCFDDVYTPKSKQPLVKLSENNKQSVIFEVCFDKHEIVGYTSTGIYIGEDRMQVGVKMIENSLSEYSEWLKRDVSELNELRSGMISRYLESRKESRNFEWYVKRLNLNSVKMILNGRRNKKLVYNNLTKYLK